MANITKITELILESLKELNQLLPPDQQLPLSPETKLFGSEGLLDSLGLINLVVILEERIYNEFNVEVTISGDLSTLQQDNTFKNIQTLSEHITRTMQNKTP
ncbi:MAG: hypothetical protein EOM80_08295 [Erysipelotrichia bacterium]|nr:hypothetical protein [Erysipelotrichia bacterium]